MILLCNHINKFLTDILIVVSAEFKSEIEWQMREQTGNPYWHLTPKQIERYTPRSLNAKLEEQEHKDRIALEEVRAKAQG